MPLIRPVSDLRNNFHEISEICHSQGLPVFLTKNGRGDMVVMSIEEYEKREAILELYRKLAVAEKQLAEGDLVEAEEVMERLRGRKGGGTK